MATECLSQEVQYEVEFGWPFEPKGNCGVILSLYDNYTIEEKTLIDEDDIQLVQEELGLDNSLRPTWYSTYMVQDTRMIKVTRWAPSAFHTLCC